MKMEIGKGTHTQRVAQKETDAGVEDVTER